jgi:serine/threonine protein kinase
MAIQFPKDLNKLIVVRELGHGAFGKVMLMEDKDNNHFYAVKSEPIRTPVPQLYYEYRVYQRLRNITGIPRVFALWQHEKHTYMAMDVLGPSLEKELLKITEWDVINWIAPKLLTIIESIHSAGFLHRDIKPENLLCSTKGLSDRQIYLVDYGLFKRYRMESHDHIPYREGKKLTGTIRYASIHTHLGAEQSRRDDLESLGYVLVYLLRRKLPWMNAGGANKQEQHERITSIKTKTPTEQLCAGLPSSFLHFFRHVRLLKFDQTPDYALLRSYFRHAH